MTVTGRPAVNYTYDTSGRLTGISTQDPVPGALNFNIGYDTSGRRTSLTCPNGITTNYTYDEGGRLITLEHLSPQNAELETLG